MDLFPFSVTLFPNIGQEVTWNLNGLSIDKEEILVLFPMSGFFSPNWSGNSIPEGIYSHDEVRQPSLYFKDSESVFEYITNAD